MTAPYLVLGVIIGLMLAEARVSVRHERALRARGAIEPGGDVYMLMLVLYPAAFVAMALEGAARHVWDVQVFTGGVLLFVAAKGLKYWAMASLGGRWSFRVLVLPGAPLVTRGPYRYIAHPNYVGVIGELAGAAMMLRAPVTGAVFTLAFAVVILVRVRVEMRALRAAAGRTLHSTADSGLIT